MYTTRTFCNFRKTHCDLYTGKYGNWPRPDQTQWQTILGMQRMKFTLQSTCINRPFIKGFIRKLHFVITEKKLTYTPESTVISLGLINHYCRCYQECKGQSSHCSQHAFRNPSCRSNCGNTHKMTRPNPTPVFGLCLHRE